MRSFNVTDDSSSMRIEHLNSLCTGGIVALEEALPVETNQSHEQRKAKSPMDLRPQILYTFGMGLNVLQS